MLQKLINKTEDLMGELAVELSKKKQDPDKTERIRQELIKNSRGLFSMINYLKWDDETIIEHLGEEALNTIEYATTIKDDV